MAVVFRFLNNNDTGERFVSRHGTEITRVAAALLLTLPGVPCVYSGDEVGAAFEPYDEGPPIPFRDRHGLRDHYKRLISLRNKLPSLRSRNWIPLDLEPRESVYGYLRFAQPAEQPAVVLLNWHAEAVEAEFALPERFGFLGPKGTLRDVLAEGQVQAGGGDGLLRVSIPPYGARILVAPERLRPLGLQRAEVLARW